MAKGESEAGETVTMDVERPRAGTYYFQCASTRMNGTIVVRG